MASPLGWNWILKLSFKEVTEAVGGYRTSICDICHTARQPQWDGNLPLTDQGKLRWHVAGSGSQRGLATPPQRGTEAGWQKGAGLRTGLDAKI